MIKIIKGVLFLLLALALIYLALCLFAPSQLNVKRSRTVSAKPETIWPLLAEFPNWEKWSPWKGQDSTVKNTYSGKPSTVGHKMSWIGDPDLSGTGWMQIESMEKDKSFHYKMSFTEPMVSSSLGKFTMTQEENGTKVFWQDSGAVPFLQRPILLFLGMEDHVGNQFDQGLATIDSLAALESKKTAFETSEVSIADFPGRNYLSIKHNTNFKTVMSHSFYEQNFGLLAEFIGKWKYKLSASPSSLTYSWNKLDSTCEVAPSFPISLNYMPPVNLGNGIKFVKVPAGKAIMATHYGPSETLSYAHQKMGRYITENKLKTGLVIDEYHTAPGEVEPSKNKTVIYYLLEK